MRCATLGAALHGRGHRVRVFTRLLPDWIADRISSSGIELCWLIHVDESLAVVLEEEPMVPDVVVIDGYVFGGELKSLASLKIPLVAIDDNHELPVLSAHLVVNQNLHADPALYPDVGSGTRLLLGPAYALIRPDVVSIKREASMFSGDCVLVSLGGTDTARLTYPLVAQLMEVSSLDVIVAHSVDHPDADAISALMVRHPTRLYRDSGNLSDGYKSADIAIVGGGSTLWEVAFLGLPALAVIVADNQVKGSLEAERAGFVITVDARTSNANDARDVIAMVQDLLADPVRLHRMSELGSALFDGRGASRIVAEIEACVRRSQRSVL